MRRSYRFKSLERELVAAYASAPGILQRVTRWPADTLVAMVVVRSRRRGDRVAVCAATAVVGWQCRGRWASVGGVGVGVGHGQESTVKIDPSAKRTESFNEQVKLDVRLCKE